MWNHSNSKDFRLKTQSGPKMCKNPQLSYMHEGIKQEIWVKIKNCLLWDFKPDSTFFGENSLKQKKWAFFPTQKLLGWFEVSFQSSPCPTPKIMLLNHSHLCFHPSAGISRGLAEVPGSFIIPLILTLWYHTISSSLLALTDLQHCALNTLSKLTASEARSRRKTWSWRSQSPKAALSSITRCSTWGLLSGKQDTWKVSPSTKPTQLILPILFTNPLSFQLLCPATKCTPKGAIQPPKRRHLMPLYVPSSTLPGLHLLQKDTRPLDYINQRWDDIHQPSTAVSDTPGHLKLALLIYVRENKLLSNLSFCKIYARLHFRSWTYI